MFNASSCGEAWIHCDDGGGVQCVHEPNTENKQINRSTWKPNAIFFLSIFLSSHLSLCILYYHGGFNCMCVFYFVVVVVPLPHFISSVRFDCVFPLLHAYCGIVHIIKIHLYYIFKINILCAYEVERQKINIKERHFCYVFFFSSFFSSSMCSLF